MTAQGYEEPLPPRRPSLSMRSSPQVRQMKQMRNVKKNLPLNTQLDPYPYQIIGTALGTYAGTEIGESIGNRLAIAYIARKYGVDPKTALSAIKNNFDLEVKK